MHIIISNIIRFESHCHQTIDWVEMGSLAMLNSRAFLPSRPSHCMVKHQKHRNIHIRSSSNEGRESMCTVSQSLTLFSLDPDYTDDQVSEVIDSTWSLQYMVRGPVCGSAGSVLMAMVPKRKEDGIVKEFNNCILFRYASESAMDQFMAHGKTKYMLDEVSREKTTRGVVSLTFSVKVPNELEAIFRRGDEWEQGYELFMGLHAQQQDDADEFLDLLCQLALSSAHGAVQAAHGPVTGMLNHTLHDDQQHMDVFECERICTIRFADDKAMLESFLQSPPMQAVITGDERSPVTLSWGLVQYIVAPPDPDQKGSSSSTTSNI